MIKTIVLSMCLATSSLSLNARAQDVRGYSYGPVTEVDYIHVEYGHFDEYMAWVTSTWVPTMEAAKKAGLIIGYKVFRSLQNHRMSPMCISRLLLKTWRLMPGTSAIKPTRLKQ